MSRTSDVKHSTTGHRHIRNPRRARSEEGMTLHSGDKTLAAYLEDSWTRADNVPRGMLPGRVDLQKKKPLRHRRGS